MLNILAMNFEQKLIVIATHVDNYFYRSIEYLKVFNRLKPRVLYWSTFRYISYASFKNLYKKWHKYNRNS